MIARYTPFRNEKQRTKGVLKHDNANLNTRETQYYIANLFLGVVSQYVPWTPFHVQHIRLIRDKDHQVRIVQPESVPESNVVNNLRNQTQGIQYQQPVSIPIVQ